MAGFSHFYYVSKIQKTGGWTGYSKSPIWGNWMCVCMVHFNGLASHPGCYCWDNSRKKIKAPFCLAPVLIWSFCVYCVSAILHDRMRLWVSLVKAARKEELWDVCRAACHFCLLYDDERWTIKCKRSICISLCF